MRKYLNRFLIALVALAAMPLLWCCGNKNEQASSELVQQAIYLNDRLNALAASSNGFITEIGAGFEDDTLKVNISYDTNIGGDVNEYSDALIEFVVSYWMKNNQDDDLETTLNSLTKVNGALKIVLSDDTNAGKVVTIPAARLKKLFILKPSQLNFNAVKENVLQLMARRCEAYKAEYMASDVEFSLVSGFAQYTFTFDNSSAYANLKQDSLRGRYQKILREQYCLYGGCSLTIIAIQRAVGIDGYRFVYKAANDPDSYLSAALPWSIIK